MVGISALPGDRRHSRRDWACSASLASEPSAISAQSVEKRSGLLEVRSIEAFGEPIMHGSQKGVSPLALPVLRPDSSERARGAQLPGLGTLLSSDIYGLPEVGLAVTTVAAGKHKLALHAKQLRLEPPFAGRHHGRYQLVQHVDPLAESIRPTAGVGQQVDVAPDVTLGTDPAQARPSRRAWGLVDRAEPGRRRGASRDKCARAPARSGTLGQLRRRSSPRPAPAGADGRPQIRSTLHALPKETTRL